MATQKVKILFLAEDKLGGKLKSLNISSNVLKTSIATLGIGLALAMNSAIKFDKSMREVNTLVQASEAEFEKLSGQVLALSKTLPQDKGMLSAGLYQIISAGVTDTAQAMNVLKVSADAAIGGLSDAGTAADAITTVLNSYGKEAREASNVSDLLFMTVKQGKTTFNQLAPAIGNVASTASAAKVSFEEVSAAIATMTRGGISTDEAVTALNRTIISIIKPSEKLKEVFKQAGVESGEMLLQTEGLQGAMELMEEATGGSIEKMAQLLPNIRGLKGVLKLTGENAEGFANDIDKMNESMGAADEATKEMNKSISNQVDILKNQLGAELTYLGTLTLPVVVDFLREINSLLSGKTFARTEATKELVSENEKLIATNEKILEGMNLLTKTSDDSTLRILANEQKNISILQEIDQLENARVETMGLFQGEARKASMERIDLLYNELSEVQEKDLKIFFSSTDTEKRIMANITEFAKLRTRVSEDEYDERIELFMATEKGSKELQNAILSGTVDLTKTKIKLLENAGITEAKVFRKVGKLSDNEVKRRLSVAQKAGIKDEKLIGALLKFNKNATEKEFAIFANAQSEKQKVLQKFQNAVKVATEPKILNIGIQFEDLTQGGVLGGVAGLNIGRQLSDPNMWASVNNDIQNELAAIDANVESELMNMSSNFDDIFSGDGASGGGGGGGGGGIGKSIIDSAEDIAKAYEEKMSEIRGVTLESTKEIVSLHEEHASSINLLDREINTISDDYEKFSKNVGIQLSKIDEKISDITQKGEDNRMKTEDGIARQIIKQKELIATLEDEKKAQVDLIDENETGDEEGEKLQSITDELLKQQEALIARSDLQEKFADQIKQIEEFEALPEFEQQLQLLEEKQTSLDEKMDADLLALESQREKLLLDVEEEGKIAYEALNELYEQRNKQLEIFETFIELRIAALQRAQKAAKDSLGISESTVIQPQSIGSSRMTSSTANNINISINNPSIRDNTDIDILANSVGEVLAEKLNTNNQGIATQ